MWLSITSSSDGTKLAAVAYDGQIYTATESYIFTVANNAAFTQGNFATNIGSQHHRHPAELHQPC